MSQLLLGRMAVKARQIRPGQAYGVEVKAKDYLQITDVQGKQVADFVAFSLADRAEVLSTAVTRSANNSIMLQVGNKLYSNRRTPLFELVEDNVGRHDMLFAACDPKRYKDDFNLDDHANCRTALFSHIAASFVAHGEYSLSAPCDFARIFAIAARFNTTTFDVAPSFIRANAYTSLSRPRSSASQSISWCGISSTPGANRNWSRSYTDSATTDDTAPARYINSIKPWYPTIPRISSCPFTFRGVK